MTPWTAAYQAPPSMGFSKQEYWSGMPLPSPSCKLVYFYFFLGLRHVGLQAHFDGRFPELVCKDVFLSLSLTFHDSVAGNLQWKGQGLSSSL